LARAALHGVNAGRSWSDRLLNLRDRLVGNPDFQRWAAASPLTRPIARRRARALFDLCAGFVYSQVLLACVRLRLFDVLRDGPLAQADLAARLNLPEPATVRLLSAALALRLVSRRAEGKFGLGALGAALVGNPGVGDMIRHHALLYGDLADPVALLRGEAGPTRLAAYWPYADATAAAACGLGAEQVAGYSDLMAASQALVAEDVLDAYDLRRHRVLLDVGGGDGSFLAAVARRAPGLGLMLFDLPAVADRARARLAAAGLSDRARVVGGNAFVDALPAGADVVSMIRVVHDHDDAAALRLLRGARAALPPAGTLLLAEPMAETRGAEPVGAYFAFYLLAMGSGRPRGEAELRALLAEAGFQRIRARSTRRPLLVRLLEARAS
jgi:demethylspheroidene O-methyltransferase